MSRPKDTAHKQKEEETGMGEMHDVQLLLGIVQSNPRARGHEELLGRTTILLGGPGRLYGVSAKPRLRSTPPK